jgi:hypothetical protein
MLTCGAFFHEIVPAPLIIIALSSTFSFSQNLTDATITGTVIDTLGHVYSPTAILRAGYWGWERVAEMLPWEYVPEGK